MSDAARSVALLDLIASHKRGVLATLLPDGRPHLSNIGYAYDPATQTLRVSVTDSRVKVRNLRSDPRASLHVTDRGFGGWAVAEGTAQLTPVASDLYDETVEELIDVYRAIAGEHPDWDDFRKAMVADRRLVVRLPAERVYGRHRTADS